MRNCHRGTYEYVNQKNVAGARAGQRKQPAYHHLSVLGIPGKGPLRLGIGVLLVV